MSSPALNVFPKEQSSPASLPTDHFLELLAFYRERVITRFRALVPSSRCQRTLYEPLLEYPLREGKGFRPALCLATCQACGGRIEEALDTAAAIEMFHNAFLIHDDIEDASETRRGLPTLHAKYGIAIATNVGDALNMLAMRTLLRNTESIGLERALTLMFEIDRMARESAEGQSIELDWVRFNPPNITVLDYLRMIRKKTCWYTCIAPLRTGALIAKAEPQYLLSFTRLGFEVGAAFQIQDDVLNLTGEETLYGKEIGGDIAEGKRTAIAIHVLAHARPRDRQRIRNIYSKPRHQKTVEEVEFVIECMRRYRSIEYASSLAERLARRAARTFSSRFGWIPHSPYRRFLEEMINYMISRRL